MEVSVETLQRWVVQFGSMIARRPFAQANPGHRFEALGVWRDVAGIKA